MSLTPEQRDSLTIEQYIHRSKVDHAGQRLAQADSTIRNGFISEKTKKEQADAYKEYAEAKMGKS